MKVLLVGLVLCAGAFAGSNNFGRIILEDKTDVIEAQWGVKEFILKRSDQNAEKFLDEEIIGKQLSNPSRNYLEDLVNTFFETLREIIINGNDVLPPLDPVTIDQVGPFEVRVTGVKANLQLNNLHLDGLRWMILDHISFVAHRLRFSTQITLPWINFNSDYEASTRVAIVINHTAGGHIRLFLNRVEVGVDLQLGVSVSGGGHLLLRELDLHLKVHDSNLHISGMFGSSVINSFINTLVQSISQDIIVNHLQEAGDALSVLLFDVINDVLKNFTLEDLLGNN